MSRPVDPLLLRHAPACRSLIAAVGALQFAGAALTVAQAILLTRLVVSIFHGSAAVGAALVALGAVALGRAVLAAAQEWITARASIRVRAQLRQATLAAVVRLGPRWSQAQPPGRLATVTGPGLDSLDGYMTRALPALVAAAVVPPVVLAAIFWSDWQSGVLLLILLPLVPLFMALVGLTTRRLVSRQYAALSRMSGQFLDLLRGLTTLRIYGRAEAQEATVRRVTDAYRHRTLAALRAALLSGLVLDLLAALSIAIVAVDAGLRLDRGHLAFRTALLVLVLAPELFAPLRAMGAHHHATEEGMAAAAAALDIVGSAPPEPATSATDVPASADALRLHGVTVRYDGRDRDALHEVSLAIRPRAVTALTGPSGAGKSTLLAVLLGFVTPSHGGVVASGRRLGDPDLWRAGVAWLPQRPRPSQQTVADEVRLGDPTAGDAAVAAVCRSCRTPAPSTRLGQDGTAISAGQRRRVALARALLRAEAVRSSGHVPLVLLDEPTEDLDTATAAVVADVVHGMRGWATVVEATHNPLLAAAADVRVELCDGRLTQVRPQRPARVPPAAAERRRPAVPSAPVRPRPAAAPYRLRDLVREAGATRRLVCAGALSMLASVCGLGLLTTAMWLISRAAEHPNVEALAVAVVGVRTFAIGRAVLRYGERLISHDGALRLLAALRVRVFAALRVLPPYVLGSYRRGDLLRRFVADVDGAQEGLVRAVVPAAGALGAGACAVAVATALAPAAGLVLAGTLLLGGVIAPLLANRLGGAGDALVRLAAHRDRRSATLIDSMDELVAYGAAARAVAGIAAADRRLARAVRRPAVAAAIGTFLDGAAAALALVGVLAAASSAASRGRLSAVNVGVLAGCVLGAFEALAALPPAWVAWARCRAGLRRVAEITGQRPAFRDPDDASGMPDIPASLSVHDVTLSPADGAAAVLHSADLELEPGQRVALTGPSGCGKSTLLAAALRLVPARKGSVALGGRDVGDLAAAMVPPVIAGSLQGDHVFDATLRDNLRVARPDASDDALDEVAARAGLLNVIDALPQRWSTRAGPDGAALSGGQRQRLLLARALLADPDILVLDEPTAHLDAVTEAAVLDDVLAATTGRTVLVTTHRRFGFGRIDAEVRFDDGTLSTDGRDGIPVRRTVFAAAHR